MITKEQAGYRQVVKATSIFGGVQVFTIIVSIIRSKFIAILLGPTGMGISGLLTATLGMIAGITNFGLATSAVKDIASAHGAGDERRISVIVSVFRRIMLITGILGTLVTIILAPWLSMLIFKTHDYTLAFVWVSITLLLNQLSAGQGVLLRGMRQIKYMAKATALGSLLGLLTTIPLYYFYGIKGIVPAIIISAVFSLLLTWYFSRKLKIKPVPVSISDTYIEAKDMLKLGFMISLSGLIALGVSYAVRIFISNTGGVDQVGLYNAGFAIVNTYVGMIFTAMSADYYPRLSAVADSNEKCKEAINQQAEIALLILAPIIMVFIVFINWVVLLLYSVKFMPINDMILFAILAMFFKAAGWAVAMIFLAKGASKLFFWNELIANAYQLVLNIIGYKYYGLTGLGISFLIAYALYVLQVYIVTTRKYKFRFTGDFIKLFVIQLVLAVICLAVVKLTEGLFQYTFGMIIIAIATLLSYRELNKRIDIAGLLSKILKK